MEKLNAQNLIAFINQLPKAISYQYLNPANKGIIKIEGIDLPVGPIKFRRCDPSKGESFINKKVESISTQMIWRVANAFRPNQPLNIDRTLGASYNTRSVFESLLAHTPQFYYCYPGRIQIINYNSIVKKGHKHLIWFPEQPHEVGVVKEINTDIVISEVPNLEAYYESLVLPDDQEVEAFNIDLKRRHAQIQVALYFIGKQLGFRTWIAQNDKGIKYENKRISEYDGIINNLDEELLLKSYYDAVRAALMIDCIWFKNSRLMPAVIEVEHSTGVRSGLTRMKNFFDFVPPVPTRYVVVAHDNDREKVIKEANKPQFKELKTKFFPYSAVEELYALCQRRKIKGVSEEFIDCYMEEIVY